MNTRTRKFLSSALREWLSPVILCVLLTALVFGLAPRTSAQTPAPPYTPQLTDTEQLTRNAANGTQIFPTFTLGQEFGLAFGGVVFPQGGESGSFNTLTGVYTILPQLFTSPVPVLGYGTGLGAGQTVTQTSSKSTAVVMPAGCWTGTIVMNNASLANGATVKFTVTDTNIAASDVVIANPQQGSITASAAYFVQCNSNNGSFVVNVTNNGTTNSDAIILNFVTVRASGN